MPKVNNTKAQRRVKLYDRITPEHLFDSTSVFRSLSKNQITEVRKMYELYFNSWLKEDAEELILNKKTPCK